MRILLGAAVVLMCAQGCGSDAPSCEVTVRSVARMLEKHGETASDLDVADMTAECIRARWTPAMRTCLSKASSPANLEGCMKEPDRGDGDRGGRRSEAELNLDAIKKSAKMHYVEMATYPVGKFGPTPSESCCRPGGITKCPADTAIWEVHGWGPLDFEISESHYFQYSYESEDGKSYVARAIGDLDCDGTTVTYELRGTSEGGVPQSTLTKPTRGD